MASSPITSWQKIGRGAWKQWPTLFSWAPISLQTVTTAMKLKDSFPGKESYDKPREHIKKQSHHIVNNSPYSQSNGFCRSHVWKWELDHKEGWALKNWCFQYGLLEKTVESPLDDKEIKPVNPKGNQPWKFIGRADTEAEALILWPLDAKSQIIGKKPDAGKDWGQEEKGQQRMRLLDDITD